MTRFQLIAVRSDGLRVRIWVDAGSQEQAIKTASRDFGDGWTIVPLDGRPLSRPGSGV